MLREPEGRDCDAPMTKRRFRELTQKMPVELDCGPFSSSVAIKTSN